MTLDCQSELVEDLYTLLSLRQAQTDRLKDKYIMGRYEAILA